MNKTDQSFVQEDFSKRDLSGFIFSNCKFYCCSFKRTNLRDAQFIDCAFIEQGELEGCDFSYSDLRDASFKRCKLSMSYFSGANCFGLELRECDLKGANFSQASFVNHVSHQVYFCSAYITGCNLSYVNFERQLIEKCDLFENRWIGANLRGASFKGSDLSRGVFSEDCWDQFKVQGSDLSHSELYGLNPRKVDLTGVKICSWQQEQLLEQLGVIVVPD
ncbi:quinolone resistance determinant QnrC [Vibrio orientalis CIP 102891 = ATCC 33934]|uniref:Qnr n=1 Tax=Vibrio orientalis CIP 102891 = ATCC 33934 TaxID=675816 RepID=C9QHY3_VIBOR|nr:Qnr family pentapeptide repeat protein [Vibrio orientalis]EEX92304.1 qnr [Vibrio orientalis CIP 102891 = ATCC 33934]EGU51872.1 quinolone resistance determinant QnrC [Vibrio orientalis CIP 102891 = ATCC 33934]